jgi:hypothetical protein
MRNTILSTERFLYEHYKHSVPSVIYDLFYDTDNIRSYRMIGSLVNNELNRISNESGRDLIEAISWHMPAGGSEKIH